jgi:hypothetical protein
VISLVIDEALARLDQLIDEGARLGHRPLDAHRRWQAECAALVNELSGGSKAHWLSRAYSQAFLVENNLAGSPADVPIAEIAGRIVGVLRQARSSLVGVSSATATTTQSVDGATRRFDFVRDSSLRPVLEASYRESRRALDERRYDAAFLTACGILEAVMTDALQATPPAKLAAALSSVRDSLAPESTEPAVSDAPLADWSFDLRLRVAERAGLIGGGCARLPASAKTYRESSSFDTAVSERDARVVAQVLNVVLRDLDPGR